MKKEAKMAKATTKDRILASLRNSTGKVFLRDDFNRLAPIAKFAVWWKSYQTKAS